MGRRGEGGRWGEESREEESKQGQKDVRGSKGQRKTELADGSVALPKEVKVWGMGSLRGPDDAENWRWWTKKTVEEEDWRTRE